MPWPTRSITSSAPSACARSRLAARLCRVHLPTQPRPFGVRGPRSRGRNEFQVTRNCEAALGNSRIPGEALRLRFGDSVADHSKAVAATRPGTWRGNGLNPLRTLPAMAIRGRIAGRGEVGGRFMHWSGNKASREKMEQKNADEDAGHSEHEPSHVGVGIE